MSLPGLLFHKTLKLTCAFLPLQRQVLMFPGKSHGRFSVTNEGTLVISSVRKEDRGYYTCSALSVVGSSMAKGHLEVTAMADLPPPVIRLGPANQTLPINTAAIMPCEAAGKPTPTVRWQYNTVPLQTDTRPRFVILKSGTLRINGKLRMITGWCLKVKHIATMHGSRGIVGCEQGLFQSTC